MWACELPLSEKPGGAIQTVPYVWCAWHTSTVRPWLPSQAEEVSILEFSRVFATFFQGFQGFHLDQSTEATTVL
jgi:hypothetical protein